MAPSVFSSVKSEPADPIVATMHKCMADTFPNKVDLSIGVYQDELGDTGYVLPSVVCAKRILAENDPGHCYTTMLGLPEFVKASQALVFGEKGAASGLVALAQTISGTGALHVGFDFLKSLGYKKVFVGDPAWANYDPLLSHVGMEAVHYEYYSSVLQDVSFEVVLDTIRNAPEKSVFLLQTCCHNPTGADFTREQWLEVIALLKLRLLLPVFDVAYQGLASGSCEEDVWPVRHAFDEGMEFLVCLSFSKNMGLYSERAGAVHVVVRDGPSAANVRSALSATGRSKYSFTPAFGARVAAIILNNADGEVRPQWEQDVRDITARLKDVRQKVYDGFKKLQTPGNWEPVIKQQGLFWYSGLTALQVHVLVDEHHVYLTDNGRINVAGLNNSNVDYFVQAVDKVVRAHK